MGREAELAVLEEVWGAVRGRRAQVAGIVGATAVGKTALVAEFVRRTGADIARTVATPEGMSVPWGTLRQLAKGLPGSELARVVAEGGPSPEAEPWYVGQMVLADLKTAGEIVLFVDDVQWVDPKSGQALRFAAQHMFGIPVLMIIVHNDGHQFDDGWRHILEMDNSRSLSLGGLSPGELMRLATAVGRPGLSPTGAARLFEHTLGNPLHARAVLDQVPMHVIVNGDGALPAHRSLASSIAAAYDRCGERTRALLDAGAVLGDPFPLARARELAGLDSTGAALDEAAGALLIQEAPGTAGREVAFLHPSVRTTVYDRLSVVARSSLHRAAARLTDGPEALRHRVRAADGPDADLAADLDRVAGQLLERGLVSAGAQAARTALDLTPPGPDRVPRLLTTVEALLVAGDVIGASEFPVEAGGDGSPWWNYVAGYQALLSGRVEEAAELFADALAKVQAGQPSPKGAPQDLEARIATQLAIVGIVTLAYQSMIKYGSVARSAGTRSPRVAAFAEFAQTVGLALAGRSAEALEILARPDTGLTAGLDRLVARGMVRLWTDDLPGADRDLREAVDRALLGEPLRVGQAMAFLGEVLYRRGELTESVQCARLAVGDAEANQRVWDYALLNGLACYPHAAMALWQEAEAHAATAREWAPLVGSRAGLVSAAVADALIAQARGDDERLLRAAEQVEELFDPLEPGTYLLGPARADALTGLGRLAEARDALDLFEQRFPSERDSHRMGIGRVRARLALAEGDHGAALVHGRDALALAVKVGLPLEAARIRVLLGEALAAAGHKTRAEITMVEALTALDRMGARAFHDRATDLLTALGLSAEPPKAALTRGQHRVAVAAARGLTNQQIADRLKISVKTVETQLSAVYRILDVSRDDLRRLFGDRD
ncbi:AAA family ATPase [Planotetraspora sp. A-T 1434]|uniref:AAA family ATPase n=1 Tax=Planotetraspora sp. A-T 1434 TaxID=2979219 RepID=UPI0021C21895|nr:AAA family ATPase [Planotetraspora sp. A-T 1434]MCT9933457.1 AAA family ATPase [Planotetraspora sp. A-T 1434]